MEQIREAAKSGCSSFYLQIVSITQSLAFGFLLNSIQSRFSDPRFSEQIWPPTTIEAATSWLQVALVFQMIVLTWHVNVGNAIIFRRLVGLSDSYIPFALMIPQFCLAVFLLPAPIHYWFYSVAAFCAVTIWAYTNMYIKDGRELENKDFFMELDKFIILGLRYRNFNRLYIAFGGLSFAVIGVVFHMRGTRVLLALLCVAFVNIAFIVFTVFHAALWRHLCDTSAPSDHDRYLTPRS